MYNYTLECIILIFFIFSIWYFFGLYYYYSIITFLLLPINFMETGFPLVQKLNMTYFIFKVNMNQHDIYMFHIFHNKSFTLTCHHSRQLNLK